MQLLDGKKLAQCIRQSLHKECDDLMRQGKRKPCLGIVLVGNNPASLTYVNNKIRACQEVGMEAKLFQLDAQISQSKLVGVVEKLNTDHSIDGFIVQLPLPSHIREDIITSHIAFNKDVDGVTPENMGRVLQGLPCIVSATPKGILTLLQSYNISPNGKNVAIIGRSNIVGKPLACLLSQKRSMGNATVTLCHSYSKNINQVCLCSDIIVVAVGHPHFLTADMVSQGSVVVDVGISRVADKSNSKGYKLVGDVDFDHVAPKCSFITPVPGGVGPMTVASLLKNVMLVYHSNHIII